MKKLGVTILIVLVLLMILISAKNFIAKAALLTGVKAITGLNLSIKSMNVGIFRSLVGVNELRLYNPPEFTDRIMVDVPEIYIDYDLVAFLKKKVHLEEVRLNLEEFLVIKNEKGMLNLDALKVVQAKKKEKAFQERERAKMPEIKIDELRLKIGRVIYMDYSRGSPPKIREFNINIDERYKNITDPYTFAGLIVAKALMNTTIASLAEFDLNSLKDGLSETLKGATTLGKEALKKTVDTGIKIEEKATEVVGQTLEKTTETIKKIIPFGE